MKRTFTIFLALFAVILFAMVGYGSTSHSSVGALLSDSIDENMPISESSDYSNQYKAALEKRDVLTNWINALKDSITDLDGELRKLVEERKLLEKDVKSQQEDFSKLQNSEKGSNISEMKKQCEQLQEDIVKEEKEADSLRLELQARNEDIGELNDTKKDLDNIKEQTINGLIKKYESYLRRSFSKMQMEELNQIKVDCDKYSSEGKIKEFLTKVDETIENKKIYDDVCAVLNSEFDSTRVLTAISKVNSIKPNGEVQGSEVSDLKNKLSLYPEGKAVFDEFIENLNFKRSSYPNYSKRDFDDDETYIYKDNLKNRIDKYLMPIPFLKKQYEDSIPK